MTSRRTRITVDYTRCGDGVGVDPRECGRCLQACEPAVFLLHETIGADEADPLRPAEVAGHPALGDALHRAA